MPSPTPKSELFLVVGFLTVIAAVPITQTTLELMRGQRVQATDVLRRWPTAASLRQFEHTLEEKSWFRQQLRPLLQGFLFRTLRDTGSKGVLGRNQWLFYRPDLRYLLEPNRRDTPPAESIWIPPSTDNTCRDSVVRAIVRFRDQLRERDIALLVVPIPGKPSVYPDQVTRREASRREPVKSPTRELLRILDRHGVSTVNLFDTFSAARAAPYEGRASASLYLAQDTHWTPQGAQLAAAAVASRMRELELAPTPSREFRTEPLRVARCGDVLEMMQIPALRDVFPRESVDCQQVLDPALGPLVPIASDRPGTYRYPGQQASVLVLGDSFSRIYQYPEPASLGELVSAAARPPEAGTKRLLPGSAGFISHLAFTLQSPVDAIVSDGGASTDVRRRLSTNPEILEGKKVVIWEFVERDVAFGAAGWEDVPLPSMLN